MALLTAAGGSCLLSLAYIADWVGISAPGFGPLQALMVFLGAAGVLLGWGLSLRSGGRVLDFLNETLLAIRWIVRERRLDIELAASLYCISLFAGAHYVYMVRQTGSTLFYAATVDPFRYVPVRSVVDAIYPYGILFGSVVALAYGIFRLGMGRGLSLIGALAFMSSPIHLFNLVPSVGRAYSKAPFVLAVVFIMGLLLSKPWNYHRAFLLSVLGGVVVGIGVWIREDLMLFAVPFLAILFFFPTGPFLADMKSKVAAALFFVLPFLFISLPVFNQSASRGMQPVVGGFMSPMNDRLSVTTPGYDWGHLLLDEYMFDISRVQTKRQSSLVMTDSENTRANDGLDYIMAIARNFPADMVTRTYAAILKVLDLPFTYILPPPGLTNPVLTTIYDWRGAILDRLAGTGIWIAGMALLFISAQSLRKATFCLFLLVYCAGYPVLQFLGKHYFFWEIIAWWMLGFLVQQGVSLIMQVCARGLKSPEAHTFGAYSLIRVWPSMQRALVFGVGALMILVLPLMGLRQYQAWHVKNLLREYALAETENLSLVRLPVGNSRVLVTSPEHFQLTPRESVSVEYLVAEFSAEHCNCATVWPVFRYGMSVVTGRPDFSRSISVDLADSRETGTRLFLPVISSPYSAYKGIEFPLEQADCLRRVSRVKDTSLFPILLTVQLPLSQSPVALHQTMAAWEANDLHTVPTSLSPSTVSTLLGEQVLPLTLDDLAFRADIVHGGAGQWEVKGYANPQADPYDYPAANRSASVLAMASFADVNVAKVDTDLILTKEMILKRQAYFVAEGVLYTGGVTFGLITKGRTAGSVNVTSRGPFTVVIQVPDDGLYTLGLANNLDGYTSLENRFVMTRFGWVNDVHG